MDSVIIEGFDFVGKSAVIKELHNGRSYHPDYTLFDKYLSRNAAFMFSYGQVDLLYNLPNNELPKEIIWDRAVISSYVYSRIYKDKVIPVIDEDLVFHFFDRLSDISDNIEIDYVYHKDKDSAKRIFESDKNHNDKLDSFKNFDEYWKTYLKADDLFLYIIKELGSRNYNNIKFVMIQTESNESGTKVQISPEVVYE
jgi:hypothetical protein